MLNWSKILKREGLRSVSGKIEITQYIILGIAIFASVTDLIWGKIFNWFTALIAIFGIFASFYFMGWTGVGQSVLGVIAGFILYGWMFGLRFMGGGDVKLLMALGAWGGLHYTEEVAILGVMVGGVMSLLILIFTGKIIDFSKRLYSFLLSIFVKELEIQTIKVDKTLTMPFGIPLSIAAIWVAFIHPFEKWGITLWP